MRFASRTLTGGAEDAFAGRGDLLEELQGDAAQTRKKVGAVGGQVEIGDAAELVDHIGRREGRPVAQVLRQAGEDALGLSDLEGTRGIGQECVRCLS